jgi:hypothetical protein
MDDWMIMKEIVVALIGAVVGAGLSCMFAIWLRNCDKWKTFQEEVGVIRSRFLSIEKQAGIAGVSSVHKGSVNDLVCAACRVKPYIWKGCNRQRLVVLLDEYRSADTRKDSGFLPADLAGHYKGRAEDCFSDPGKAIKFLVVVLDDMARI